jgi:hypothetical protein
MKLWCSALVACWPLFFSWAAPAGAEIKGPNGEKCATTASGVEHVKDDLRLRQMYLYEM